ncbi:hypothetical protein ABFS82_05G052800 [Erythranthe guttata]
MGGDLHTIAFSNGSYCNSNSNSNSNNLRSSSSVGWDLHNHLGVFNADMSLYDHINMESSSSQLLISDNIEDFSTGYLQDVLFQFSSKRRRLLFMSANDECLTSDFDTSSFENCIQDCCQDFDSTLSQITRCDTNSDVKTPEEEIIIAESYYDSSSSSQKESESADEQWKKTTTPENNENLFSIDPIFSSAAGGRENETKRSKKRVLTAKVVYPFAVVKPGGIDGDVTLNDINERILMPPTRAVRHPVGDFACRPLVSPEGPGLSGKAVVAFTRLHTPGRGSITIIRTRG